MDLFQGFFFLLFFFGPGNANLTANKELSQNLRFLLKLGFRFFL
uniref:Sorbitol dehydrogenase n=1 Tax=Rhizophora mucronata TaxID=61149 RepID=A0A2P2LWX0_RHIMU